MTFAEAFNYAIANPNINVIRRPTWPAGLQVVIGGTGGETYRFLAGTAKGYIADWWTPTSADITATDWIAV